MFIRYGVAIMTMLVLTVFFVVMSLMFRKRALPIIFSIMLVMLISTVTTVFGYFSFNMPSKAVDDYIEIRHERYEEMVDDGDYSVDVAQMLVGNPEYADEIDFSKSLAGGMYSMDYCDLEPRDFKNVDSMHMSYTQVNLTYLAKSLVYIVVIGGYGFVVFRKKNLF